MILQQKLFKAQRATSPMIHETYSEPARIDRKFHKNKLQ